MTYILGISAYYHDSAAALLKDGKILYALQEERFSRIKHDARFPVKAIKMCLSLEGIQLSDVDCVVFYDKPLLKFERLVESYLAYAPKGWQSFKTSMPIWLKEKLYLKREIKQQLSNIAEEKFKGKLFFSEHHLSHAASAFYPSPFDKALILCLDGVGEWATSSAWLGEKEKITPLWQINFPHSIGLLYSAFTYFTGFKVNSGEYKLMGLAPYGEAKYSNLIREKIVEIKDDGSYKLNMEYFDYVTGLKMTNDSFAKLFKDEPRKPNQSIRQLDLDIAASIQEVTEEIILKLANTLYKDKQINSICLSGGVALNCVANSKLLQSGPFSNVWIQPASGDAGGSLGAALALWYLHFNNERRVCHNDNMRGAFLGNKYSLEEITHYLDSLNVVYSIKSDDELCVDVANEINNQNVVGWYQGPMEFGPRALGGRSIIGDPRSPDMQMKMNMKIKFRESFRPFAPAVLEEYTEEYFDFSQVSPYMLFTAPVKENHRKKIPDSVKGLELLSIEKSDVPAITHADYSARLQTVSEETNPKFHKLISSFYKLTGIPMVINTSFNVRGEPPVCSPKDAFECFMATDMDILVLEQALIYKSQQPEELLARKWKRDYEPD
ncbi:carbamoyltransferase [Zooshikella marina]|uniref:carbamoyltransferase family protein n=1 Tax=Zooshikella ganghwensis TaxID=202772 RepID=UPI001BB09FF4|nr:carbamoyltransferase [Zooshikella ganghwensis]MBU2707790.1 carbamoyltransferase [Zooshikella ganghwensis]